MIVGAPSNDAGGNGAGAAYILFGKGGGFGDVDLTSLSASDGFKIQGAAASDAAGTSVSSAGDVNGDGFDDIIIGAPGNRDGPGKAYVVFGKADGLADIDLASLSDDDGFAIQGKANGDKTGDGNDLVKTSVSFSFGGQAIEKLILTGKASIDGTGNGVDNAITGNAGRNVLEGLGGNDRLDGGDGNDHLFGGSGGDHLLGGAGRDTFVFNAFADSTIAKNGRDTIGDFSHAQHDHIDLSAIDAEVGKGNQDFHFIADAVFSGTAGELRFTQSHGDAIVQGDVNGDGKADFAITVESVTHLIAGDFVL